MTKTTWVEEAREMEMTEGQMAGMLLGVVALALGFVGGWALRCGRRDDDEGRVGQDVLMDAVFGDGRDGRRGCGCCGHLELEMDEEPCCLCSRLGVGDEDRFVPSEGGLVRRVSDLEDEKDWLERKMEEMIEGRADGPIAVLQRQIEDLDRRVDGCLVSIGEDARRIENLETLAKATDGRVTDLAGKYDALAAGLWTAQAKIDGLRDALDLKANQGQAWVDEITTRLCKVEKVARKAEVAAGGAASELVQVSAKAHDGRNVAWKAADDIREMAKDIQALRSLVAESSGAANFEEIASGLVENLRKRTADKFKVRDEKIERLEGRVAEMEKGRHGRKGGA